MKPRKSKLRNLLIFVGLTGVAGFMFIFGFAARHFSPNPISNAFLSVYLKSKQQTTVPTTIDKVFDNRFTRQIPNPSMIMTMPATNFAGLDKQIETLHVPISALQSAKTIDEQAELWRDGIYSLGFSTANTKQSLAFYQLREDEKKQCAVVLIPGSGLNRSTLIAKGTGEIRGIRDTIEPICDLYILIKPNHGPLTITNGQSGLMRDVLYATMINDGYSYSVTYLSHAQALVQHIQSQYPKVGIVGLSQGGEATLFLSRTAQPDFAVISSGYSILNAEIEYKNFDQILFSGYREFNSPKAVRAQISQSDTEYLFTWGLEESGAYNFEANTNHTCSYLQEVSNKVSCTQHKGGHEYPLPELGAFIKKHSVIN